MFNTLMPGILIVGAGIGGLTLAHALNRHGIPFDLIDRVPQPAPVGAGLMLHHNALNLLDKLGFHDPLRERGLPFTALEVALENGETLQLLNLKNVADIHALGIHRAELHQILGASLKVAWGQSIRAFRQAPEQVHVTLSSGEERRYALLVGADGLRSGVRGQLLGVSNLRYSGYTCWRFTTAQIPELTHPVEYWGKGRRLGLVNIGQGRNYGYATLNAPAGQLQAEEGRAAHLQNLFQGFPDLVQRVLTGLTDQDIIHDDLHELAAHHWHADRVALLGDAAHAMTPNLGQGAGMAIEDAVVLAECLRRHGLTPQALKVYAEVRQARVRQIANQARLIGLAGQLQNPMLIAARNKLLQRTPQAANLSNLRRQFVTDAPRLA